MNLYRLLLCFPLIVVASTRRYICAVSTLE